VTATALAAARAGRLGYRDLHRPSSSWSLHFLTAASAVAIYG